MPERKYGELPWQGAEDWLQNLWSGLWGQPQAQADRPPIAQLTPYTQQIMETPAFQQFQQQKMGQQLGLPAPTAPTAPGGFQPTKPLTLSEAEGIMEGMGGTKAGYYLRYDADIGGYRILGGPPELPTPAPGITPWQESQQAWQQQQQEWQEEQFEMQQQWQQQQLEAEQQWREEQIAWQREEAERVERARLSAQPQSWLQYASYTGETPGIQPWMLPLMPQQYQELGAGGAIPGWTAESGAGMPQLARPSRQLQARMGPTALAQYGGYRQARTGERPEEAAWRLGATAPPGGGRRGLQWAR